MPERPVTVRIESYSLALGAFASLAPPGRTSQKTVVVGFLPPAAFADAYGVLQGEDPIFLEFTTNDGNDLTALHLKTDQEPFGEGPVNADGSPSRG